jgi:hypothetical protein
LSVAHIRMEIERRLPRRPNSRLVGGGSFPLRQKLRKFWNMQLKSPVCWALNM